MENMLLLMKTCQLFFGMTEEEVSPLMDCLRANERSYKKGSVILMAGERPEYIGVVVSGSVHVVQEDFWGNRTILTSVQSGGLFAEAFSCAEAATLPVSAISQTDCKVLLIDSKRILTTCATSCSFHARLVHNLMKIIAKKNIMLTQKIEYLSKKSTRDRVLSYLSECAFAAGSNSFTIPFDRQELADYLSVERSALSNTLSKMQSEGIINFEKNRFVLLIQSENNH